MNEHTEKIDLRADYWQVGGPILGDVNPPHYGLFADFCSYPEPSAPAVYLLALAERSLITDNRLTFPIRVEANLHVPAFAGEYEIRKKYSPMDSELSFWIEGGPVTEFNFMNISSRGSPSGDRGLETFVDSSDLKRADALLGIQNDNQVYFSFAFGRIIDAFFRDEIKLGAVLGSIEFEVYQVPEIGSFNTVLDVEEDMRSENGKKKAVDYFFNRGDVYQGEGDETVQILRVIRGMFHQRIDKERERAILKKREVEKS
jgi:hypothetical protein